MASRMGAASGILSRPLSAGCSPPCASTRSNQDSRVWNNGNRTLPPPSGAFWRRISMDLADKNRFLDALAVVEAVCCDPMDELRLRAYWLVLGPSCTIEEWEQACLDVLTASTF